MTSKRERERKKERMRERLFNSIPRGDSIEYKEREASLLFMKGVVNNWIGNNDVALKYHSENAPYYSMHEFPM